MRKSKSFNPVRSLQTACPRSSPDDRAYSLVGGLLLMAALAVIMACLVLIIANGVCYPSTGEMEPSAAAAENQGRPGSALQGGPGEYEVAYLVWVASDGTGTGPGICPAAESTIGLSYLVDMHRTGGYRLVVDVEEYR